MNIDWKANCRNYSLEKQTVNKTSALTHPLRINVVLPFSANKSAKPQATDGKNSTKTNHKIATDPEFVDPLGATLDDSSNFLPNGDINDIQRLSEKEPVLRNTLRADLNAQSDSWEDDAVIAVGMETWASKRQSILHHFTTNEKLSIVTSFLPGGVPLQTHLSVVDRTHHRLEQLSEFEDSGQSLRRLADLSQQEYISRINQLNSALLQAWTEDQRVQSVKIVIQCAKLLGDVGAAAFYPSQAVLVYDILQTFGRLVYQRLREKADQERNANGHGPLGRDFSPSDVPTWTQETARNWFYKVASIRELLPRFYVEAALLRCRRFLAPGAPVFPAELNRLASLTRGIAHPLVATYARCYLCRIGITLDHRVKEYIWQMLHDWMKVWPTWKESLLAKGRGEEDSLVRLFWPALEWLLGCLTHGSSKEDFEPLLGYCKQKPLQSLLLSPVLATFPAPYIAANALEIAKMLLPTVEDLPSQCHWLLRCLGKALVVEEPAPQTKRPLLREMWKAVMKLHPVSRYLEAGELWFEFACRHFGVREVNTLLEDIIRHVNPDRAYEDFYPQLLGLLNKILTNMHDFQMIFSMERFLAFLDLFQKDSVRVGACHQLLDAFSRRHSGTGEDPALANHVLTLCRSLHDSLNALSLEDQRRTTVSLICRSLDKFRFETNQEDHLTFLVEARGSFSNLDSVVEYLVRRVNSLIVGCRDEGLVRACVAYAYITIPSIQEHFTRLRLYSESAAAAVQRGCLPQTDALLKAAISLIPEVPTQVALSANRLRATEPQLLDAIQQLLSLLLVVPDSPEQNQPLYLFQGLLNAVKRYPWPDNSDGRSAALIKCLAWLSAAQQPEYLYHVPGLESNDALYGNSIEFRQTIGEISKGVLDDLLNTLKSLAGMQKRQAAVSLELLDCVLAHGDLAEEKMRVFAGNLWGLARKNGLADKQKVMKVAVFLGEKLRSAPGNEEDFWRDLCKRMKV